MFSCEYGVILKAPVLKNIYERLLLMRGADILLMRFGSFTVETKWKFLHFISADSFRLYIILLRNLYIYARIITNIVDVCSSF